VDTHCGYEAGIKYIDPSNRMCDQEIKLLRVDALVVWQQYQKRSNTAYLVVHFSDAHAKPVCATERPRCSVPEFGNVLWHNTHPITTS
jgi:hypothetical protein